MEKEELLASFSEPLHAVIQGGTRGIGLALVEALLARSATERVYVTGRSAEQSEALAELRERYADKVVPMNLDLLDEPGIGRVTGEIREQSPALHLLINAAGVLHDTARGMQPEKKLEQLGAANALHAFAVNALAPALVMKGLMPAFRHDARSVIANVSARVGSIEDNRLGGWYSYRATKAAQNQFTRTAAIELGRRARQAIVIALHPGTVDTALSEPFQRNVPEHKLFSTERAARQLLDVIDGTTTEDSGRFFSWDGSPIPW